MKDVHTRTCHIRCLPEYFDTYIAMTYSGPGEYKNRKAHFELQTQRGDLHVPLLAMK